MQLQNYLIMIYCKLNQIVNGHLLGAAGSVEAIFSILSINKSVLPATLNLENPIDTKKINLVPNEPK